MEPWFVCEEAQRLALRALAAGLRHAGADRLVAPAHVDHGLAGGGGGGGGAVGAGWAELVHLVHRLLVGSPAAPPDPAVARDAAGCLAALCRSVQVVAAAAAANAGGGARALCPGLLAALSHRAAAQALLRDVLRCLAALARHAALAARAKARAAAEGGEEGGEGLEGLLGALVTEMRAEDRICDAMEVRRRGCVSDAWGWRAPPCECDGGRLPRLRVAPEGRCVACCPASRVAHCPASLDGPPAVRSPPPPPPPPPLVRIDRWQTCRPHARAHPAAGRTSWS
jgi:hypothetical protein